MKKETTRFLVVMLTMLLCFLCTACGGKDNKDAFATFAGEWTAVTSSVYNRLVINEDGSWELYKNEGTYTSGELDYHSEDDSVWISPDNNTQWSRLYIEDDGSLYCGPIGTFILGDVSEENISEVEEELDEELDEDLGDDWRDSGDVISTGMINNDDYTDLYVLVTVDDNGAYFYWDEPEQLLFDSVSFPLTIPDAREYFDEISFDDINGDGESDVTVSIVYPSGEYTYMAWIWDPEERYVFQWDWSVFANSNDNDDFSDYTEYLGYWEYPDGTILEISEDGWNLYEADEYTPLVGGPVEFDEEACYLMNDDGSSGGGMVYFDENGYLNESDYVLNFIGMYR